MIAAATWAWVLVGVAAFLVVGVLVMLALGAVAAPADAVRRLWHTLTFRRPVHRGVPLADEAAEQEGGREPRQP